MGGAIGDVYLSSAFKNHDRRIPIPGFDVFGTGTVTAPACPNLVKALGLKVRNPTPCATEARAAERQATTSNDQYSSPRRPRETKQRRTAHTPLGLALSSQGAVPGHVHTPSPTSATQAPLAHCVWRCVVRTQVGVVSTRPAPPAPPKLH
jgi:hypothetical protein